MKRPARPLDGYPLGGGILARASYRVFNGGTEMTFEAAALKFALTMVPGVLGWFRGRRIKEVCGKAYEAAASRAIDNCEKRGYPTRSHVWNELSTLLQDAKRAQALARLMRRSIGQLPQYQRVLSVAPETEMLVADFLRDLNERLAEALPEEQRFSLQVQLNALALIAKEIRPRRAMPTGYGQATRPAAM